MKIKPEQANTLIKQNLPTLASGKQYINTKNITIQFYLIECPHKKILRNYSGHFCHFCMEEIEGKPVGSLMVGLDKDGFLEAKGPLRVQE